MLLPEVKTMETTPVPGGSEGGSGGSELEMARLIKQVSIESPSHKLKECIFNFDEPMPDVPELGARVKVRNAGVCYRLRSASSSASIKSLDVLAMGSPLHHSVRDTSLFPGYEVAGTIDSIGSGVSDAELAVGDRVIVYPYEGHPPGYGEYIAVPEVKYLVKIPDNMSLSVAAMLPSGALWAMNTVFRAREQVTEVIKNKGERGTCSVLLVGTGGLALWALRIVRYFWPSKEDHIKITVACLRDEGISILRDELGIDIVQWSEDLYEEQLVDRTRDACGGTVDVVIDFSATSRSVRRAMKCLEPGGVVLVSAEHAESFLARYTKEAEKSDQKLVAVQLGSLDQLKELVQLVGTNEIEPPPHHIFPADRANEAIAKIGKGQIQGRAILEFPEEEEEE
ncbi:Alcohol dehydrogenase N-terminal [Trinorchestia longiramus]|nr:Alcohol dehydrogenase N-terminal [Trinorchestia longiramus]